MFAHAEVYFPFLDEAPEFKPGVLDALRQPMEIGELAIARARGTAVFPARFQLVLAANPCPCGKAIGKGVDCECSALARRRYLGRVSGPVMDRVDLRVTVTAPTRADLAAVGTGEPSQSVALRVRAARDAAITRWGRPNGHLTGTTLRGRRFRLDRQVTADLDRALDLGVLTLRGYDRTLRIGWTLADLGGATAPDRNHLGEALTLRGAD